MRKAIYMLMLVSAIPANADVYATGGMKNDWRGKTVLTTEPCQQDVARFNLNLKQEDMKRVFYMTGDGQTSDGCWKHDNGSVLLAWPIENVVRRWPISNFKLESGWK